MVLHDEHLFKCRLPLVNLQLELTNEQTSKHLLFELNEEELNQLIEQMTQIEQVNIKSQKHIFIGFIFARLSTIQILFFRNKTCVCLFS